tara:strand:- start:1165 stop:1395 length:231 start_codon:yes stop_codon:yes gene_type:complete
MSRPSGVSCSKSAYYQKYYQHNKHRYILNYQEKKARLQAFDEIYKPYGGEKEFYRKSLERMFRESNEENLSNRSNS